MTDPIPEIVSFVGRLALAGEAPSDREELFRILRAAGFADDDIVAALDRAGEAPLPPLQSGSGAAAPVDVLQLSDDATHFLGALRDLGYLDDATEDEVLDHVMDEFAAVRRPGESLPNVELDDLRRHVAAVLFDRQAELEPDTLRFLQEEWRVAFH